MVLQEDAILHSEDVRNHFFYELGFIYIVCVATRKCDVLFLHVFFSMQSLRKMAIITTHLQYQWVCPLCWLLAVNSTAACYIGASAIFPMEAGVGNTGGAGQEWVPSGKDCRSWGEGWGVRSGAGTTFCELFCVNLRASERKGLNSILAEPMPGPCWDSAWHLVGT